MDTSGPLGAALVDRLLRRGYTVHAATYSYDDEEQLSSRAGSRLKVFRADPFDYHAIVDAVRGCAGVFCMFNTPQDQDRCDVSTTSYS
jgi:nucleoside-diphosphate-sugar epimerase